MLYATLLGTLYRLIFRKPQRAHQGSLRNNIRNALGQEMLSSTILTLLLVVFLGNALLVNLTFKTSLTVRTVYLNGCYTRDKVLPGVILMIRRPCDLNLVMISLLASKCQHFKLKGFQFYSIKWLKNKYTNFKVLAFLKPLKIS